jgi:PKD repeat protein
MTVQTNRLLTLASALAVAGCTLGNQAAPNLTGPSELGLSLQVRATPDIIRHDGVSQAQLEITATDGNGLPVRNLTLRLETAISGVIVDFGFLSSRNVSTNNDGRAAATYVSPPPPPPTAGSDIVVDIVVTPVGSNYQNTFSRTISIRLARPGVLLPPNGAPVPNFFFSPSQPKEGEDVVFDGSSSTDDGQIVSYFWNFGDGSSGQGKVDGHDYELAGTYAVTLTVTDDRGISATSAPKQIVVSANTDPVANFTFSPTSPAAGQQVHFNGALSKAANGRSIVDWEWDFGDGPPRLYGQNVNHVFTAAGTYNVVLTVTDSFGKKASIALPVTVRP